MHLMKPGELKDFDKAVKAVKEYERLKGIVD